MLLFGRTRILHTLAGMGIAQRAWFAVAWFFLTDWSVSHTHGQCFEHWDEWRLCHGDLWVHDSLTPPQAERRCRKEWAVCTLFLWCITLTHTVFLPPCLCGHVLLSLYLRAVFMTTYYCLYGPVLLSLWPRTVCMATYFLYDHVLLSVWPRTTVFMAPYYYLYGHVLSVWPRTALCMATYYCLYGHILLSLWPSTVCMATYCLYGHVLSVWPRNSFMATYCCLYGHVLSVWPHTVCLPRTTVFISPCCLYGYILSTLYHGRMLRTQKLSVSLLAAELLSSPLWKM